MAKPQQQEGRSEHERAGVNGRRAYRRWSETMPDAEDEAEGVRARAAPAARRAGRDAGVGQGDGREGVHRVRGPRHAPARAARSRRSPNG